MEDNNTNMNVPNNLEKKSRIFNIIIIVLVLALIAVFIVSKIGQKNTETSAPSENASSTVSGNENGASTSGEGVFLPEPTGEWTEGSIKNEITFDVPPSYYVSYPVIGECRDVVSISTQASGAPTLPIALIYKDGCVTDTVVTSKYTYREVKKGYVFQTNSSNSTVVSLFNRIVASAK